MRQTDHLDSLFWLLMLAVILFGLCCPLIYRRYFIPVKMERARVIYKGWGVYNKQGYYVIEVFLIETNKIKKMSISKEHFHAIQEDQTIILTYQGREVIRFENMPVDT